MCGFKDFHVAIYVRMFLKDSKPHCGLLTVAYSRVKDEILVEGKPAFFKENAWPCQAYQHLRSSIPCCLYEPPWRVKPVKFPQKNNASKPGRTKFT